MKFGVEIIESIGLLLCLLLAAPLRFFRRLDRFLQVWEYAGFLLSRRLFARMLRARLDYRIGNFHQAAVMLGPVISHLEQEVKSQTMPPLRVRRLLCTLYCDLQQLYFLCGQVEDAVIVVIRAHNHLGIDRLPSNPDLDLKTAHVVKAGIAASKLLEDGGLATLMVRQGDDPIVHRPQPHPSSTTSKSRGYKPKINKKKDNGGVVIPFPQRT